MCIRDSVWGDDANIARAKEAEKYIQDHWGSKHFDQESGDYDSWMPFDSTGFDKFGVMGEAGVPLTYNQFRKQVTDSHNRIKQKKAEPPFWKKALAAGLTVGGAGAEGAAQGLLNTAFQYDKIGE